MVTVSYQGGPGDNFNIFSALAAWLNPHEAVVPEDELFAAGQTQQQTQQQDTQQMTGSQQTATAAALAELHIPYPPGRRGAGGAGLPRLRRAPGRRRHHRRGRPAGDRAVEPDHLITAHPAGSTLTLTIVGRARPSRSGSGPGNPAAHRDRRGDQAFKFPFTVTISVGDIGGPSAGMMFALGIIDKLTPLNLTGGKFIAGTGEIDASGQVEPIGGIQQKMVGARDAGATVFLAPAANCPDTKGAVPAGLRLVKVSTLGQAVTYLEALKAGQAVPPAEPRTPRQPAPGGASASAAARRRPDRPVNFFPGPADVQGGVSARR